MSPQWAEFSGKIKALFHKRSMDSEMAEELELHRVMMWEKLLRQGVSETQAEQAVARRFGNSGRWHERLREVRQFRGLENLLRDMQFSARLLRKSPGFTAVAVITLALGIGANTAIFSLINALLYKSLAAPNAQQLAVIGYIQGNGQPEYDFPYPYFQKLDARKDMFQSVFAFDSKVMQVKSAESNENVPGQLVSGEFFEALGTAPLTGRYLTPADDVEGGSPTGFAVVISEGFWTKWFHRGPEAIGSKLVIANVPFTIVGVMPKSFVGADPTQRPEIFVPLNADAIIAAPHNNIADGMHAWWLTVMAQMKPGDTLAHVNAGLESVSKAIQLASATDPELRHDAETQPFRFVAEPGSGGFAYARFVFRKPLMTMFAMCVGILVLACVNLASLLMARSAARERELATRLALGASRKRLVQQLLSESAMIALLGTLAGIALVPLVGLGLNSLAISDHSGNDHVQLAIGTDWRLLAFTAAVAMVATILIGLIPALQSTSGDLNQQIKTGQHAAQPRERKKLLPRVLMTFEVGLALVLVVGAGLLATSLVKLFHSGLGFDPQHLESISFRMDKQQLDGDALMRVYQQIGDGISHQPGVVSSSFQFIVPISGPGWNGRYNSPGGKPEILWLNAVGPKYFETMRIPIFQGREFTWNDTKASGMKITLNASAAKLLFGDRNPIGETVVASHDKTMYQVVAVVGDAKYRNPRKPAPAAAYVPLAQGDEEKPSYSAVVRVRGSAVPVAQAARELAAKYAPTIPAPVMLSMDDVINNTLFAERMLAWLSVFFAVCALLVTAIGLYGTLSYATARRTSEIGIRMALGAKRGRVVSLVFRENVVVAVTGAVAGLIAALLATKALASFLYETSPHDPWILSAAIAILICVASAASLLPAIRAARIEPITAIRYE
ncbi:ADOP family duplicated permease [Acidicapsa dinghuensis]|uniref:ADOP family duplicated permease n=1 Tax=Acidicapsa dinghuensis TaxID=2218256 RepID=A0ABW1EN20_9BACT|nr:ABC transporter permease [Acidicapsa dinghuensis]